MTLECEIIEVLESWPLELLVRADGRSFTVALTDSTTVRRGLKSVSPGELQPGQKIAITSETGQSNVVDAIEIL